MDPKKTHERRMKLADASLEHKMKYIDTETGFFDEVYTAARCCPVCGSDSREEVFYVNGGKYCKCCDCTMIYLNPVFTDEALDTFYRENHTVQSQIVEEDEAFYTNLYEKGLRQISNQFDHVGTLLDVGCSSGAFLQIAQRHGWNVAGIELNQEEAALAQNKGLDVYNSIQQFKQRGGCVDVITLWDVFEHIKDGRAFLQEAKSILSEKGVVFLQIPVADALAAKILQEHCNMFDGLEHVNIYGEDTITKLVTDCDMTIVSYTTVIAEVHVLNNYLNYEDPYSGSFFVKEKLFGCMDEKDILAAKLGYKAQVVLCNGI